MSAKILKFVRPVNGVVVEQRRNDGFINGTAMCVAHSKNIADWLRTHDAIDTIVALANDLGIQANYGISHNSSVERIAAIYPTLVVVKRGAPINGGGTWLHPDLAVYLAQWCNKPFAIQVSRWIQEWLLTGCNPIQTFDENLEQEWQLWRQRYDIRIELKDSLRPELMSAVVRWAEKHSVSPIRLCSSVHDAMNERIQGVKAKQIRLMGGLPLGVLLRDHFDVSPLISYSAINRIAKNAIIDRDVEPVQAVHEACDHYLGKAFTPSLVPIAENLYFQGRRLKAAKQDKKLKQGVQLDLALWHSNSEPQVS